MAPLARALPLGLLLACSRPPDPSQALLPTQLSVLVERAGPRGPEPLSVVLDLRRNSRDELDVRISPGMRLWDGRRLWEVSPTFGADGHGLHVADLRTQAGLDLPVHAERPLTLAGMTRRDAWVAFPNGSVAECELDRPVCAPAAVPELPLDHPGPGAGFQLVLDGGELHLRVPFAPAPGVVVLDNVARIVGVHWVHETWLDRDPLLDRTYRGWGMVRAVDRPVRLDGDLAEWADAAPLVVDAPWQVESGAEHWSGARDGGFSVAASRVAGEDAVCFAGRVRDDDWTAGDTLTFHLGAHSLAVPVLTRETPDSRVGDGWFSRAYEVCMRGVSLTAELPFAAIFHDHDGDDGSGADTVLASSPSLHGQPEGSLRPGG